MLSQQIELWAHSPEPRLSKTEWENLSEADTLRIIDGLFDYYRRFGYPHYSYNATEKAKELDKIRAFDYGQLISDGTIRQTMHGLGLAWSYFPHALSVRVGKMLTPSEVFEDDDLLRKALARRLKRGTYISHSGIRKAIRTYSGVQAVSNFRPTAAAAIYDSFAPEDATVWDCSCGFGGRLLGAIASRNVATYIGTDPGADTMTGLHELAADLSGVTDVKLHQVGSEDFVCDPQSVDLCFTSPPYFDTERYSNEDTQSWVRYGSPSDWNEGFLRGTIESCRSALKSSGWLILNVANVTSHPTLVEDTIRIAVESGFAHTTTLRLALSSIAKGGYKYEPVLVFKPVRRQSGTRRITSL